MGALKFKSTSRGRRRTRRSVSLRAEQRTVAQLWLPEGGEDGLQFFGSEVKARAGWNSGPFRRGVWAGARGGLDAGTFHPKARAPQLGCRSSGRQAPRAFPAEQF